MMNYELTTHLQYHVWATGRLEETLRPIHDSIFDAEVKSSFTSIRRTIMHIWDAEAIWLKRMQGVSLSDWPSKNFVGSNQQLVDEVVQSAHAFVTFIQQQGPSYTQQTIRYVNLKGDSFEDQVDGLIYHMINHGSYHRGQITTLLRELGITEIKSMDIIHFLRAIPK